MKADLPLIHSSEELKKLDKYFKPFPEIDKIFVENQSWLKEHFLPLISIDLGVFKDEWRGQIVHILNPIEPYEGYIGEKTKDYHNEFTGENWLAFKLTADNRYEFLGNEGYFIRTKYHNVWKDEDNFNKKFEDYKKCKALFQELGYLTNICWENKEPSSNLLSELGGNLDNHSGMNWFDGRKTPKAFSNNLENGRGEDGYQILYQDNPFYLIATVPAWYYGCSGADSIILMYEPISRIVLFTYDWT